MRQYLCSFFFMGTWGVQLSKGAIMLIFACYALTICIVSIPFILTVIDW